MCTAHGRSHVQRDSFCYSVILNQKWDSTRRHFQFSDDFQEAEFPVRAVVLNFSLIKVNHWAGWQKQYHQCTVCQLRFVSNSCCRVFMKSNFCHATSWQQRKLVIVHCNPAGNARLFRKLWHSTVRIDFVGQSTTPRWQRDIFQGLLWMRNTSESTQHIYTAHLWITWKYGQ